MQSRARSSKPLSSSCRTASSVFFFIATATTKIYTLSLHDALPISPGSISRMNCAPIVSSAQLSEATTQPRSEEHTSELQSLRHLVCRLLLEKKKRVPRHPILDHDVTVDTPYQPRTEKRTVTPSPPA